jgi:outer membrane protein assembly factor BamB
LLAVVMTVIGVMYLTHSSMVIPLVIYGISAALTVLVVSFTLTKTMTWNLRRLFAFGTFAAVIVGSLLFRVGRIDAAFAFSLVPRWAPTAEESFLAELDKAGGMKAVEGTRAVSGFLPEQLGENDWGEFRGPARDGILRGVEFETDWKTKPPTELWRKSVGPGWSSFCVVGPLAFTQEQRGEEETVVAYRVDDGSQVWVTSIKARFEASMGGLGPRATPTYFQGRLYLTGGTGVVQCLDASTGKSVWAYDLVKELSIKTPAWGFSSSPLIVDDLAIVFAGGGDSKAVIALDREKGTLRWSGSDGNHAYGSPQLATIDDQRHIVISSNLGLRGLDIADGSVLWKHDWDVGPLARVTQPLMAGNAVYLGTGYGNGTQRVNVRHSTEGWKVEESWTAPLKPYFNDFVYYQGHLYGFDDSIFTSIDAETGDRNWKRGRYGFGQVLLIEQMGVLLVLSEKGEVVLLRADPERHKEIASIDALEGVTWNHPVIADGKLFVRNAEEAACYALPGFTKTPQETP